MIKKTNTYVLNGKELSKKDLKNYLVFEPNMIEENIKKVLKYDKIEKALENECFYDLGNAIIVNTKDGYCLYDLNGKKSSDYYNIPSVIRNAFMPHMLGLIANGMSLFEDENELITTDSNYEKVKKNNKVGFFKNNKKVISPLYDDGHFINGTFVMKNGLDIYMFDEDGKNLILDNKISEICSNISKYFNLDLKGNDLETLYKLLSMKIISKKEFLYDLENNKIVIADKVIKKYKLSTDKREIIIDRTNKKVKTRKK